MELDSLLKRETGLKTRLQDAQAQLIPAGRGRSTRSHATLKGVARSLSGPAGK